MTRPDETRSEAKFVIVGEWLAESVTGCTCGTGGTDYGHEAGCGLEPVAKIADLLAAEVERPMLQRELAAARAEVTRLRQAVEALHHPTTEGDLRRDMAVRTICAHCRFAWPCMTGAALAAALGGVPPGGGAALGIAGRPPRQHAR